MSNSPDSFLLCPSCGGLNAPDSKFCRHCGHALDGALAATSLASAPPANGAVLDDLALPDDVLPSLIVSETETAPTLAATTSGAAALGAIASGATAPGATDLRFDGEEVLSSPGEIDARHARQLVERSQGLAERGDIAGAVLACRQATTLAPTMVSGQMMLGALLERSGDLPGAFQALERANQLAPDVAVTRDLARLREKMAPRPDAPVFHFNDAELFGDDLLPSNSNAAPPETPFVAPSFVAPPATVELAALATADAHAPVAAVALDTTPEVDGEIAAQSATPAPELTTENPADAAQTPATSIADAVAVVSPGANAASAISSAVTPASATPAVAAAIPPSRERRSATVPVRVERRVSAASGLFAPGAAQGTPIGARVQAPATAAAVVNPLSLGNIDAAPQGWNALWARPSYFGRSLPLVGATILALGFLGWARALSARNLENTPVTIVASVPTSVSPPVNEVPVTNPSAANASASNLPPLAPVGSATVSNGGFPITNQAVAVPPLSVTPPVAAPATGTTQTTSVTRTTVNPVRRPLPRALPSSQLLLPASIPPAGSRASNGRGAGNNSGFLTLPPPIITPPAPVDSATSILPPGSPPLNPAGSAGRGYVRITQGRVGSILPQRSSARAGDAERAAAVAARNGSTGQAVDGLTNAINANSGDAGFRFQQRAMLFLSQSDYSRAADDFQSAISAYSDQIARGDQSASTRAGLNTARSGLNRALAGGR